jgi:hypothetical protein
LIKAINQTYYEKGSWNDATLGKATKDIIGKALIQSSYEIKESGLDCSHMNYEKLTEDPIESVKNIYQQFGWEYTKEYETLLINYLKDDQEKRNRMKKTQHKSLHSYKPEEYSLTASELSTGLFAEYCRLYNIPNKE